MFTPPPLVGGGGGGYVRRDTQLGPFKTAVPLWQQTSQITSSLPPKRY